jgi:hypothetical protein
MVDRSCGVNALTWNTPPWNRLPKPPYAPKEIASGVFAKTTQPSHVPCTLTGDPLLFLNPIGPAERWPVPASRPPPVERPSSLLPGLGCSGPSGVFPLVVFPPPWALGPTPVWTTAAAVAATPRRLDTTLRRKRAGRRAGARRRVGRGPGRNEAGCSSRSPHRPGRPAGGLGPAAAGHCLHRRDPSTAEAVRRSTPRRRPPSGRRRPRMQTRILVSPAPPHSPHAIFLQPLDGSPWARCAAKSAAGTHFR